MTDFMTFFQQNAVSRYTTNSEWDDVKDTFLLNLGKSIECIRSGELESAPFVRQVLKDGKIEKAFWGFAFGYAKNDATEKPYAFPNRILPKGVFQDVNDELADHLEAMMGNDQAMEGLLADLKAAWQKKVNAGQRGIAARRANAAAIANQAPLDNQVTLVKAA